MMNDELRMQTVAAKRRVVSRIALWGAGVAVASATGWLQKVPAPLVGPLIVGGIAAPSVAYARSPRLKALAREVGIQKLSLFHTWRVVGTADVIWSRHETSTPSCEGEAISNLSIH